MGIQNLISRNHSCMVTVTGNCSVLNNYFLSLFFFFFQSWGCQTLKYQPNGLHEDGLLFSNTS